MGVLAWFSYRRLYSLGAKNGLYKSLINSMAHDLKSPLMVMQGFCENLAENVHKEKKEYYAEQVLNNANYLNELMDKNVNLSMKNANDEIVICDDLLMSVPLMNFFQNTRLCKACQ